MRKEKLPDTWVGREVVVELKNEREGSYTYIGWLRAHNDAGIELSIRYSPAYQGEPPLPGPHRQFFTWPSVTSVRLLEDLEPRSSTLESGLSMREDDNFRVDLEDVRSLEISYSLARPYKADLAVEYVGGRVRMFVVDIFLIERLLEQLEYGEA